MKKYFQLNSKFSPAGDQPNAISTLVQGLNNGLARQILLGVTGSGKTFTIANVIQEIERPTLIIAPNKTLAAQLYGEFKEFFPNNAVEYFVSYYDYYQPEAYVPSSDTFIEKDAAINEHIEQMRLSATKALLERKDAIIIASVSAIYGLGDPKSYMRMLLHLSCKEQCDARKICLQLIEMQYTRSTHTLARGQFRIHGDVIDIYPADSEKNAVRIDLFDDIVESIAYFDPLTGEIIAKLPRITIYPKTHYVTPRERILQAIELVKQELQQRIAEFDSKNLLIESQRIQQRTNFDIEMMLELGYCSGIENYSRYLSERNAGDPPPTLLDYLPSDSLLIIDESHVTIPQIGGMYKGDRSRKETLVNYGFRLPSALDNRPMQFDEFIEKSPQTIYISATPGPYEYDNSDQIAEQLVRPTGLVDPLIFIKPVTNQVDDLLSEIRNVIKLNERVLVTTLTKRQAEDLTEYLSDFNIKVRYLHADVKTVERMEIIHELRLGTIDVLIGINLLREGLDIPEVSLVAILDADKEGFLRSERSLIQTIGRAARHINGRAILYADRITGSIQRAMDETNRRREKQIAHNQTHGIIPQGINKQINNLLENVYSSKNKSQNKNIDITKLSSSELSKQLKQLEKTMYEHAKNMEFELAAKVRDEFLQLQQLLIRT